MALEYLKRFCDMVGGKMQDSICITEKLGECRELGGIVCGNAKADIFANIFDFAVVALTLRFLTAQ
jgi:hypothetical protein